LEGELALWLPVALVATAASALTVYSAWNRRGSGRYLCDDCRFNNETDCLKTDRPKAVVCTSYRPVVVTKNIEIETKG
jgi:hypothetical protein